MFLLGSILALALIFIMSLINAKWPDPTPAIYEMDKRDIVISAASVAGLPHIAELYFNAPDTKYFNEGDIAYSLAAASNKPDETKK